MAERDLNGGTGRLRRESIAGRGIATRFILGKLLTTVVQCISVIKMACENHFKGTVRCCTPRLSQPQAEDVCPTADRPLPQRGGARGRGPPAVPVPSSASTGAEPGATRGAGRSRCGCASPCGPAPACASHAPRRFLVPRVPSRTQGDAAQSGDKKKNRRRNPHGYTFLPGR